MRILVILLLLTSYVHAQSDCIVKLPVEGGDSVVFNLNTVLYAVQTNNRTGVALNDNNVRSGYIRTGVIIDTVVARCNNELILFTDAQNGLKTAINRQQILEVKKSISNKAVIVAKWNPRLSFTSTESYASIRALVDACNSGGSAPVTPTQAWVNTTGLNNNISGLAYGNGLFLSLSYPNNIIVSTDARQWGISATLANADFDVTWGLAFGNGVFVAITNRDSVVVSSDGVSWTKHKITGVTEAYTIGFGNGKFIIVADDTKILYSVNGTTWTTSASTVGANQVESKAVYGSGRWVIVGFTKSYNSVDGVSWVSVPSAALTADFYQTGAYGNGRWVYVDNSFSYTSTNSTVWTKTALPSSDPTAERGFTFGQGKFMLSIGEKIYSSLDGVTWTQVHTATADMTFAAYGNGIFTFLTNGTAVSYLGSAIE